MLITAGGIVFLVVIFLIVVAIILIKNWRKAGSFSFAPLEFWKREKKTDVKDNCIIISDIKGIYTEYRETVTGIIPQMCRNNNRDYYVIEIKNGTEKPYYPSDITKYYHPKEWAQVLMMKANEELFKKRNNLFRNVHVWSLVAAMGIEFIIIVIM